MKKSFWLILSAICVLAGALVCIKIASAPKLSDEDQIRALLARGESTIEHKDVKGMLSCVSPHYSDRKGDDLVYMRLQIMQVPRIESKLDVALSGTTVRVDGDKAAAHAQVSISIGEGESVHHIFSGPIDLTLKKEACKHWLIFPAREWKIADMSRVPGAEE